jgi:VCBS repeat-containing protein
MTHRLEDELWRMVARMDNEQHNQEQDKPGTTEQEPELEPHTQTPPDELQDIYVLIVREREAEKEEAQVVESTLGLPQQPSMLPAYAICCLYLLLVVSTLAFQLSCLFNPPIATVTIIPKAQTVTVTGTLQLGRLLHPITISQSQTVPTTGKGHQYARSATGYLTFYNGQFQRVFIAAGTVLTGASGIPVVTDQDAELPAANPPIFGQASVPAHVTSPGGKGNIPAYDINQACCATSVLAKNVQPFTGGQDEREFQTVAQSDIAATASPLKTAVTQSLNGALQGQLQPDEQVFLLPCRPIVTSDHQIGQEAAQVNVTASLTCSAVAYNSREVAEQATSFLSTQARQQPGAGYSLFGTVHVWVKQATIAHSSTVFLSFSASGTWVYGLSQPAQQRIKYLLAGKTTQEAVQLLAALPGMEQATIRFTGFTDATTKLPKQSSLIHLVFIVM